MQRKITSSAFINSTDPLRNKLPIYLYILIFIFRFLASMIAYFHILAINKNWTKIADFFEETSDGSYHTLRKIWLTRMLRRLLSLFLRTPLRKGCMHLVNCKLSFPQESGCIITICHTPWARLLAEWCRVNNFALIFAGGPWIQRTGRVNIPGGGYVGLRRLLQHLRSGGKIIVMGDNMDKSRHCFVTFFEKKCSASILPARLASIAGVPLLAITPKLENGLIQLHNGITIRTEEINTNQHEVTQRIFTFFEHEILCSLSIWAPFILQSQNQMSSYTPSKL